MSTYRRNFHESKYMTFLIKDDNCKKNIVKSEIKSAILRKMDLIVNLYTMKNI